MDYKFLLETILKYRDHGIIVVNTNANVVYYNEPRESVFEIDKENAIGRNILDLFDGLSEEESTFYHVLKTGKPIVDYVQTFTNYKGNRVTGVTTTMPLIKNGKITGAIEILGDANNYKELSKRIIEFQTEQQSGERSLREYRTNGTIYILNDIIGDNICIKELKRKVYKIADSSSPVLVYGETGTGKELIVQAIHNASFRRRKLPFIAQNCAAIPKNLLESILFGTSTGSFTGAKEKPGLFELADGGTIFLDEINSMDLELQAKLLRVLQEGVIRRIGSKTTKKINVRVMSSTNVKPLEAVEKGMIRRDLYYRLNVISLEIPPLRKRKDDIGNLVKYFIEFYNKSFNKNITGITYECIETLKKYDWPGNVRELKYTIENIMNFIEKSEIRSIDLPDYITLPRIEKSDNKNIADNQDLVIPPLKDTMQRIERDFIIKALVASDGNHAQAARLLEIPRQTLHNKIIKYKLKEKYEVE